MADWLGGSDEPRAWGRSLDTSCSWKCRGSTSTLQRIINRHTMLWTFKSLCVSVAKDADPFAHPLVLQHPACNSLPSLPHPFARWVTGCWACSPQGSRRWLFLRVWHAAAAGGAPGACPHPGRWSRRAAAFVAALQRGEESPSLCWACSRGEQQGWGFPAGAHFLRLAA